MTRMVRDLPNWPPQAGGAKMHGGRTGISAKDVTIRVITKIRNDQVEFTVNFGHGWCGIYSGPGTEVMREDSRKS
jgi:hypothetical protein